MQAQDSYCSWNNKDDFIFCELYQVDLLKVMFVSGVATQGCMTNDSWVHSYKFVYRGEFEVWTKYMEADTEQVSNFSWTFFFLHVCYYMHVSHVKSRNLHSMASLATCKVCWKTYV